MELRKLVYDDAIKMLEWMHDEDVVHWLNADFNSKTIEDCECFIEKSWGNNAELHLAIVDDENNYMGTVSLKHIDTYEKNAEFAITVRKEAMGKGYSSYGMREILRIGLCDLNLERIFWCVSEKNVRAIKFYDKHGYKRVKEVPYKISERYDEKLREDLIWYMAENKGV